MDRLEQEKESHAAEDRHEEESDTMDDQNSDQTSSGEDDYDSDDSDMCQDIVTDVRDLYKREKVEVLAEVIKCRTEQLRLHRQLEVYQYALEAVGGEKTRLQLDLALTTKMLLVLKEALTEQHQQDEKVLKQINMTSEFIGDLDMKRVQLIKETRQLAAQFATDKAKAEEMFKERAQVEVNRCRQLQEQLDALTVANNDVKQQLVDVDEAHRSLTSAHSQRLNELAKLTEELQETQTRIVAEVQSNTALKENVDMLLAEKTQLSTEIIQLENRIAELEEEKEAKLAQMERASNSKMLKLEQQNNGKLTELEDAWKSRYEEEMKKYDGKLTDLKTESEETNKQNAMLNETIEKLRKELQVGNKQLEQEKDQEKKMDMKIGNMQTMLDDRNHEVCSLKAKLNSEQKRFQEQKQQFEQKFAELEGKLNTIQEEADKKAKDFEAQLKCAQVEAEENKSRNEQLVKDLAQHASTISAMESAISKKDEDQMALKEKLANAEKAQIEIDQMKTALAGQISLIASLEEQLKPKKQEETRANAENLNNQPSAQITSTPLRPSNLIDSLDIPSKKKMRVSDTDVMSVHSSISNYTSFQGNVDRKRDSNRFFMRKSPSLPKRKLGTNNFFRNSSTNNSDDDLISLASTVNLDEEPLETLNITSSESPVPLVKPFFRRQSDKK